MSRPGPRVVGAERQDRPAPLVEVFERRGLEDRLLRDEREALAEPKIAALPLIRQLEWLGTNRTVGVAVTAFVGGVRTLLLAGASIACLFFAGSGAVVHPIGATARVALGLAGLALGAGTVLLGRALGRRMATLRTPLPSAHELGLRDD